jgi:uncharacterized protein
MRIRIAFLWLTALIVVATPAHARRVALVIGNAAYTLGPLANPVNDAEAIGDAFRDLGFAKVIRVQNATKAQMEKALGEMARESQGAEMAVVFFAGHGTERDGRNYLIPVDAKLDRASDLDLQAIALPTVLDQIAGATKLKLVILDACRNTIFPLAGNRRSATRGLARIEPEDNTLVAYAAKDGTVAQDGAGAKHSPFTAAVLKHLPTPGLEISFVFRSIRDSVMSATERQQQPHVYGTLGGEPIYLAPPITGSPTTSSRELDMERQRLSEERHRLEAERKRIAELQKGTEVSVGRNPLVQECDRLAAPITGASRLGVRERDLNASLAIGACRKAVVEFPNAPRFEAFLARALMKANRYSEAFGLLESTAAKGEPTAMYLLALMFSDGLGTRKDPGRARAWLERAATGGNGPAMNEIGRMYEHGIGVAKNNALALSWYKRGAESGDAVAMENIGSIYTHGTGVSKDYKIAMDWFLKAAELGADGAMNNIGFFYANGLGVNRDMRLARGWFERAAAEGNTDSIATLKKMGVR